MYTYKHICIHTYIHTHIHNIYIYIHTYILLGDPRARTQTYRGTLTYRYARTCVHFRVCVCVCVCVWIAPRSSPHTLGQPRTQLPGFVLGGPCRRRRERNRIFVAAMIPGCASFPYFFFFEGGCGHKKVFFVIKWQVFLNDSIAPEA